MLTITIAHAAAALVVLLLLAVLALIQSARATRLAHENRVMRRELVKAVHRAGPMPVGRPMDAQNRLVT